MIEITITPDADTPTHNNWNGVPDTLQGGFPNCAGYCSEIVWHADSLGLQPGHSYRVEFIIPTLWNPKSRSQSEQE